MDRQPPVDRVTATPAALAALARLRHQRGAVILYQSGGCCDGSLPVCLEQGELRIGGGDVLLGSAGARGRYRYGHRSRSCPDSGRRPVIDKTLSRMGQVSRSAPPSPARVAMSRKLMPSALMLNWRIPALWLLALVLMTVTDRLMASLSRW